MRTPFLIYQKSTDPPAAGVETDAAIFPHPPLTLPTPPIPRFRVMPEFHAMDLIGRVEQEQLDKFEPNLPDYVLLPGPRLHASHFPFRMGKEEIGPAPTPGPEAYGGEPLQNPWKSRLHPSRLPSIQRREEFGESPVVIEWFPGLSTPTLPRVPPLSGLRALLPYPLTVTTGAPIIRATPAVVTFDKVTLYPSRMAPPTFTEGEETQVDKWFTPFGYNLDRKRLADAIYNASGYDATEVISTSGAPVLRSFPAIVTFLKTVLYPSRMAPPELPIPDEDLLPKRIPWDVPLGHEFRRLQMRVLPTLESFLNLETTEPIHPDALYAAASQPNPRGLRLRKYAYPSEASTFVEVVTGEEVTIDKWYSPLTYEFRRPAMPVHLIELSKVREIEEVETISLDKFWAALSEPQRRTVRELRRHLLTQFWPSDQEPLPDVPGVVDLVYTASTLPIWILRRTWDFRPFVFVSTEVTEFIEECTRPLHRPDAYLYPSRRPDESASASKRADELGSPPRRAPDCPTRK